MTEVLRSKKLPTVGPFDMEAVLLPDPDTMPSDSECYSPEDIEAWKQDWWSFVGVVVNVRLTSGHGGVLGSAAIWGLEDGNWADGRTMDPLKDNANGYLPQLIEEAHGEALLTLHDHLVAFQRALDHHVSTHP